MFFIPISILAYALNAGSILIDKILLKKSVPQPIIYAFTISILSLLIIILAPLGYTLASTAAISAALFSGITFSIALFAFFSALAKSEASIVGPVVGALNPLFSLIIGTFLGQSLTLNQTLAVLVLVIGALTISFKKTTTRADFDHFLLMLTAGFFFGLSYVLLKSSFDQTNFITTLINKNLGSGIFALGILVFPKVRADIFASFKAQKHNPHLSKLTAILLFLGQAMGAIQGLLLSFATSLANPSLVNSLFGIQYLVILLVSIILYRSHPHLLDERLTKSVITQKIIGVVILSFGLYLLTK